MVTAFLMAESRAGNFFEFWPRANEHGETCAETVFSAERKGRCANTDVPD
jgi:hypothetical protein